MQKIELKSERKGCALAAAATTALFACFLRRIRVVAREGKKGENLKKIGSTGPVARSFVARDRSPSRFHLLRISYKMEG